MAKKQQAAAGEAAASSPATPVAGETEPAEKKGKDKEGKTKEPKAPREAKAKAPKGERGEPRHKAAPTAPAAAEAPGAPPAAIAPQATAAAGEPSKKRGKRPGVGPRRGKKLRTLMRNQQQKVAKDGPVPLARAVNHLKQMKRAKFDETIEIHMWLGVDPTQNDQLVRGSVPLPHGIGKSVRVIVFCQGDNVAKAQAAGADQAGGDDLIAKIQGGWLDFDVALATQDMMGKVSRLGKVLGPRGLMPTPKAGTVVTAGADVGAAVREFKAGKVEYRTDKGGNVHAGVGKMSFDDKKLVENVTAFVEQVRAVKPAGVKGNYIRSITLSATMSPGIPVTV
jgi:large subunit ribosomal protein L1